jgi:hypothetical protein
LRRLTISICPARRRIAEAVPTIRGRLGTGFPVVAIGPSSLDLNTTQFVSGHSPVFCRVGSNKVARPPLRAWSAHPRRLAHVVPSSTVASPTQGPSRQHGTSVLFPRNDIPQQTGNAHLCTCEADILAGSPAERNAAHLLRSTYDTPHP